MAVMAGTSAAAAGRMTSSRMEPSCVRTGRNASRRHGAALASAELRLPVRRSRSRPMTTPSVAQQLANPTFFMGLSARALPWLWGAASVLLACGLWLAFFSAPPDYQQGHTVKIMFVHVPSAWLAMGIYVLVAASSFGLLVFRHPLADVSAKAAMPLGATFTALALVTGSLWGKPMWGA